jgi:UDP-glucose 4-epimerase
VIFYLAHRNTPVSSDRDLPSDALLNGVPLLNLLQSICGRGDCPHVVYFSSGGAMYARSTRGIPYVETDPCAPSTSYGIQKAMAEQYLRMAAERGRLTATVLRIGNAYGDLLPAERMQGLIGVAINNVLQGRPVVLFGNPQNVRDYVHLDDICDVAERVMRPLQPFAIFNVGTQRGHTVHQVLDAIDRCTGLSMERQCSTDPCVGAWLPDWCVLDVSKAASVLGWTPKVSLRVGIERMLHAHAPRLGRAS